MTERGKTLSQDVAAGRIRVIPLRDLNKGTVRPVLMRVIGQPSTAATEHGIPQAEPERGDNGISTTTPLDFPGEEFLGEASK
jgi:hypothetical protein